eukprot:341070-Pelagomonas_calceolata.AAC.1
MRHHFGRSTHLLVIGVTKVDSKMKSMLSTPIVTIVTILTMMPDTVEPDTVAVPSEEEMQGL